jgi:hypothetical protein
VPKSMTCARPTPRRTAADCCFRFPARACESPSARRPLRGLPVPVHETCEGLPNSLTPGGARSPCPHSSDSRHGHPPIMRALAPPNIVFRGSITRPAHAPSYASPCRSPCTAQGRGFRGVDSSPGRTCATLDFSRIFTHLLSHAGFPPAHHNTQCWPFSSALMRRADPSGARRFSWPNAWSRRGRRRERERERDE